MTLPAVTLTELDGALGILSPDVGDTLAIVGPCDPSALLPINTPCAFARAANITTNLVAGELAEAAAYAIERYGKPVVVVRTAASTAGSFGAIDVSCVEGTAVIAFDASSAPNDEYEPAIRFPTGGTLGTSGITLQVSLDAGRTWGPITALGAAYAYTVAGTGVTFIFNPPANALVALANDLRTQCLAHFPKTSSSVHGAADSTSGSGIGAAATDNASAVALANQLRTAILAHLARGSTVHAAADTTNGTGIPAAATTQQGARVLLVALKAALNAHEIDTAYHTAADTNLVTAAAPAAGTLVADDLAFGRCSPPKWSADDLAAALTALKNTSLPWDLALVCGGIDATAFDTVNAWLEDLFNAGKDKTAFGNVRRPNVGESEATYRTSLEGVLSSLTTTRFSLWGGYAKTSSSLIRRNYGRPAAWSVAARAASLDAAVSLAEIDRGPLPGVSLRDANGNPEAGYHDEAVDPGLDDLRLGTLRTVDGYPGVYVTLPRILALAGSDFDRVHYRRVMNIACRVVRDYLKTRLSKAVRTDKKTGFILPADKRDIEANVNARLRTALLATNRASAANFVLSGTDNILSTRTLTGATRIQPLGYPEFLKVEMAFYNPALRTV